MPFVADRVLDLGLNVLDVEATHIYICAAEPTDYTMATGADNGTTQRGLGNKNFGAGLAFTAPAASTTPAGRKVDSAAISDGSVTTTGTATHWAVVDATNLRLLAAGSLSASQAVTSGNTFTLASFAITLPRA